MRVRYCKSCKAHIKGFDHHCPAFGNCIGQNNYFLFMVLLVGFISAEVFYIACSFHVARKFQIFNRNRFEISFAKNLAVSTMLFSLLQVLWQVVFLIWHIYCICFNIRTDEWVTASASLNLWSCKYSIDIDSCTSTDGCSVQKSGSRNMNMTGIVDSRGKDKDRRRWMKEAMDVCIVISCGM